jgi:hypothetical protein
MRNVVTKKCQCGMEKQGASKASYGNVNKEYENSFSFFGLDLHEEENQWLLKSASHCLKSFT